MSPLVGARGEPQSMSERNPKQFQLNLVSPLDEKTWGHPLEKMLPTQRLLYHLPPPWVGTEVILFFATTGLHQRKRTSENLSHQSKNIETFTDWEEVVPSSIFSTGDCILANQFVAIIALKHNA